MEINLKWIVIGIVVLLLLRRPARTPLPSTVYRPNPLYAPWPGPNYAQAPPTAAIGNPPVRPTTNAFDVATAGIGALTSVFNAWDPFGSNTGDN